MYIKNGLTLGYTAHTQKRKKKKEGALVLVVLKNLAFNNSRNYFIYFNTSLYNTLNINDSIFFTTFLKYYFFIHFLFFFHASLSLFPSISLSHLKILKNNQQSHSHLHSHLQPTANSTAHSKATATSIAIHSL